MWFLSLVTSTGFGSGFGFSRTVFSSGIGSGGFSGQFFHQELDRVVFQGQFFHQELDRLWILDNWTFWFLQGIGLLRMVSGQLDLWMVWTSFSDGIGFWCPLGWAALVFSGYWTYTELDLKRYRRNWIR
jgi:hypothetical protein